MENESIRWLEQSRQDLSDAEYNLEGKRYNVACFLAQQAGEKTLKAFISQRVLRKSGFIRLQSY